MNWYDKAEDDLVNQVNSGEISESEFNEAMRDLRDEYNKCRQDAADEAYDNY